MKIMLKKIVYPFTDWAWLKLVLAMLLMGGVGVTTLIAAFGSTFFLESHHEAVGKAWLVVIQLLFFAGILSFLALVGYLKRVARQPEVDPLKLPAFRQPLTLAKEGFLTLVGTYLSVLVVEFLLLGPIVLCFGLLAAGRSLFGKDAHALVDSVFLVGLAGSGVLYLTAILAMILWFSFFVPLLAVRYSYTGRFRSFFEFRWAWNAVTIAPFEYVARTMAWSILLVMVTILTPLTFGVAWIISYILGPFSMLNCAYLMGDYYNTYLND